MHIRALHVSSSTPLCGHARGYRRQTRHAPASHQHVTNQVPCTYMAMRLMPMQIIPLCPFQVLNLSHTHAPSTHRSCTHQPHSVVAFARTKVCSPICRCCRRRRCTRLLDNQQHPTQQCISSHIPLSHRVRRNTIATSHVTQIDHPNPSLPCGRHTSSAPGSGDTPRRATSLRYTSSTRLENRASRVGSRIPQGCWQLEKVKKQKSRLQAGGQAWGAGGLALQILHHSIPSIPDLPRVRRTSFSADLARYRAAGSRRGRYM